jgi:hypothetical protein
MNELSYSLTIMLPCLRLVNSFFFSFMVPRGYVVVMEMSLKLVPCDGVDICMGATVCLPPICCHTKELVCDKKNFLAIHALGDHELLLNSLKPIFGLHGVLGL